MTWGSNETQEEYIARDLDRVRKLIRDNKRLREALVAMHTVMDAGPSPRKLDEALSWHECDEKARALCDAALEATNG